MGCSGNGYMGAWNSNVWGQIVKKKEREDLVMVVGGGIICMALGEIDMRVCLCVKEALLLW